VSIKTAIPKISTLRNQIILSLKVTQKLKKFIKILFWLSGLTKLLAVVHHPRVIPEFISL